jgi:hypothetical protein
MERGLGHFLRPAKPLHGVAVAGCFAHRLGVGVTGELRRSIGYVDGTWGDRDDADSVSYEIRRIVRIG